MAELAALPARAIAVLQPTALLAAKDSRPGAPTPASGAAQLAWIDVACDLAARGEVDAMVTGPVSKEMVVRSRAPGSRGFAGHTEHLEARLHAREVVMAFWTPRFTTSLVTTHLPLASVPRAITPAAVARASYWLAWLLAELASPKGRSAPRIAVAALNPHAGEGGLFGREEIEIIAPAIAALRAEGFAVEGPMPPDTMFHAEARARYDAALCMYHDQALIPLKTLAFWDGVNVTLGLPIVRTSPDHGTALDIAGQGKADPRSMMAAIRLAARIADARYG